MVFRFFVAGKRTAYAPATEYTVPYRFRDRANPAPRSPGGAGPLMVYCLSSGLFRAAFTSRCLYFNRAGRMNPRLNPDRVLSGGKGRVKHWTRKTKKFVLAGLRCGGGRTVTSRGTRSCSIPYRRI